MWPTNSEGEVERLLKILGLNGKQDSVITIKVAFSRQDAEKVYVQHLMRKHADEVLDLIRNGAYIYVCGDARTMARDVNSTLVDILANEDNTTLEEAEKRLKKMRSLEGRFVCVAVPQRYNQ